MLRVVVVSLSVLVSAGLFALPVSAKGRKASPLVALAAEVLHRDARDVTVLATALPAAREQAYGSAALVKVDDGSDGGVPTCWLLELSGRPTSPGTVASQTQLSVCPTGAEAKQTRLSRVALSLKHDAWLLFTATQRVDSYAKGMAKSGLWALVGVAQPGETPRIVFERTSTAFFSKADPSANSSEVCQPPVIAGGGVEPTTLSLQCDSEAMLGKQVKRSRATIGYSWNGERFLPN
jgi:hypothetical protein